MSFWIYIVIIASLILILLSRRKTRQQVVGICSSALDQTVRKNANKEKILELLKESPSTGSGNKELSNSDIREALGVSERSAVRYMEELERESKVEQVGSTGRSATYRLR